MPLLRAHCVCVLLLGVNGVGEAYAFAAMSRRRLDGHNRVLVGLTVLFLGLSWLLSRRFGAVGFVAANCANMALRIAFRCGVLSFIRSKSPSGSWKGQNLANVFCRRWLVFNDVIVG